MKTLTKTTLALGALLTATLLFSSTSFEDSPRCEKKASNIQEQIVIAKKMNNSNRVNGLEISLSKVKAYCSDENIVEGIEEEILEAREDLYEHMQDYHEAFSEDRGDKMQKYLTKIEEDRAKIKSLEIELKG